LKNLSSTVWISLPFIHTMKNRQKNEQILFRTWIVFGWIFVNPSLSVITKFCLISFHLGPKSFGLHEYRSYLPSIYLSLSGKPPIHHLLSDHFKDSSFIATIFQISLYFRENRERDTVQLIKIFTTWKMCKSLFTRLEKTVRSFSPCILDFGGKQLKASIQSLTRIQHWVHHAFYPLSLIRFKENLGETKVVFRQVRKQKILAQSLTMFVWKK